MSDPQATRPGAAISFTDLLLSAIESEADAAQPRTPALPVARLVLPHAASTAHYTVSAIDVWGRLADRSSLHVLQWPPGQSIAVSVVHEAVVVTARLDGHESVTGQGHLRLPAPVRHRLRLQAGDRLLLVACPDRGLLVAYTMSTLDGMVLAHHSAATRGATP